MKNVAIIAGLGLSLVIFSCNDEEKVEQTIQVENIVDELGKVIDSLDQEIDSTVTVEMDTTLPDIVEEVEVEKIIETKAPAK